MLGFDILDHKLQI